MLKMLLSLTLPLISKQSDTPFTFMGDMKKEELRNILINHLDRAVVPFKFRMNRDTPAAQSNVAMMRAYLKAGCDFNVCKGYNNDDIIKNSKTAYNYLKSKVDTCYLRIKYYEFEDESDFHTSYMPSIYTLDWIEKEYPEGYDWY